MPHDLKHTVYIRPATPPGRRPPTLLPPSPRSPGRTGQGLARERGGGHPSAGPRSSGPGGGDRADGVGPRSAVPHARRARSSGPVGESGLTASGLSGEGPGATR